MERSWNYCIAGHRVRLSSAGLDLPELLPSLAPFACDEDGDPLVSLSAILGTEEAPDEAMHEVGDFETGNGHIRVCRNDSTGDYIFLIRNFKETPVAQLHADSDFSFCRCTLFTDQPALQTFALNNSLMMVYAFAGARHGTLLIHASCVRIDDKGYAFIAPSGTGKSTQTGNWLKCFPEAELLNDDNPVVRIEGNGTVFLYGSPWSGKTPCYRNIRTHLSAIARIEQALENRLIRKDPVTAFATFLPSCSCMKWDSSYRCVIATVTRIVSTTPIYTLRCLPDEESARVCRKGFSNC